jgi:hypothetical protein
VLEQWQQEALGFARACSGSHQCVEGGARQKPLEGLLLMPVGREGQRDLREPVAAAALVEGQRYRDIGPLQQPLALGQEAIDQPAEARCGGVKGGAKASQATCSSSLAMTEGSKGRDRFAASG